MAKKIMTCKSAPEIELQFDGGDTVLLRFDIRCLANIQELEGGLNTFFKMSVSEMAATLIYAAGKDINENFDKLKAMEIVSNMTIENITDIMETFHESVGNKENNNELVKKMMAQFLAKK